MAAMREADVIAVTGVTGGLGGRVATRLARERVDLRLVARDPNRVPHLPGATVAKADYADAHAMHEALRGVGTLLLVSASGTEGRVALHTGAVDAAVRAGVGRIVYISFLGAAPDATFTFARDHWHTERHIVASGVPYTFLRDSIYLDLMPDWVGPDGVLRAPAGDGRVGAVTRDDIADVAAAVLCSDGHAGQVYDVTGPEAFSLREFAAALSRAVGRRISYRPETVEEAYASRSGYGAPDRVLDGWVSTYTAIAAGELAAVTDTVPRLAGHPATGLAEHLRRHPESVRHLRG
jgi:NAD(P)H dehydrogenase (quinone)